MLKKLFWLILVIESANLTIWAEDLSGSLNVDPECTYDIDSGTVDLECFNPSDEDNLKEILEEISSLNGDYYNIDIRYHNYPLLQDDLYSTIPILSLSFWQCGIVYISDEAFSQLDSCTTLYLFNNAIKNSFMINAPELDSMFLNNNQLEVIQRKMLNLPKATNLIFNQNKIKTIESDAFADLPSLTMLELEGNQIRDLPSGVFQNLNSLEYLNLGQNLLEELKPDYFIGLDSLTSIDLQHNLVKFINIDCFLSMPSLTSLKLGSLKLTNITGTVFSKLESLDNLELGKNFIKEITDDSFDNLVNLDTLLIDENQIKDLCSFTKNIRNSTSVKRANFNGNKVTKIESNCFKSFPSLSELSIGGNQITKIDSGAFNGVENSLVWLVLANNKLQDIKQYYFTQLALLQQLDLSYNQLSTIEVGSFSTTVSLETLDLSHNCLYKLDPSLFGEMTSLRKLVLSYNVLQRLDNNQLFSNLMNLKELYLDNNLLFDIEGLLASSDRLVNITKLYLNQNLLTEFGLVDEAAFPNIQSLQLQNNRLEAIQLVKLNNLNELDLSQNKIVRFTGSNSLVSLNVLNLSATTNQVVEQIVPFMSNKLTKLDMSYLQDLDPEPILGHLSDIIQKLNLRRASMMTSVAFLQDFQKLNRLDLSENPQLDITELQSVISSLSNLDDLILENMSVESLDQIGIVKSLKSLNLNWNSIKQLRKQDFGKDLTVLYLKGNNISYIENGTLSSLISLQYLDLSYNSLLFIESLNYDIMDINLSANQINNPPSYLNLYGLWRLDMSNNNLEEIGILVTFMIKILNFSDNKIRHLRNTSFGPVLGIDSIYLNRNYIESIDPNSFIGLNGLSELDLSENQISRLDSFTLSGLSSLKKLNLSHNMIEFLDQSAFLDLEELLKLDLSFNRLMAIEDGTFEHLIVLTDLHINNNPNYTKISFGTLRGLNYSLKYLELDLQIIYDPANLLVLQTYIKPKLYPREILDIKFYSSLDLVFSQNEPYAIRECKAVLYGARIKVKLNLYTSDMFDRFIRDCFSIDLFI